MKTRSTLPLNTGLAALLVLGSTGTIALAEGSSPPVCAPVRDVSSLFGRGPVAAVDPHCLVERKVRASPAHAHVANVLGRGGPTLSTTYYDGSTVSAASTGNFAVEYILGRAGTTPVFPVQRREETLVNDSSH